MEENYKVKIGTFKPFKYFAEKGMVFGSNDWNNDFYDIFEGETCEFVVFDDGVVFHKETNTQVDPDGVDFGCMHCNGGFQINKSKHEPTVTISDRRLCFIELGESIEINYCPMCGRKLKTE